MPTDATGTPTSLGIRKYNTSVDPPSGLGFNGAMDDIDALLVARVTKPAGIVSGEVPVWNGAAFVRSSITPLGASSLPLYSAYVPTWTSTGTLPALGNGTILGRYAQFGKFTHAWIILTMGSTTTFGTGNYIFSTPVAVHASTPLNFPLGRGVSVRGSVYPAEALVTTGGIGLAVPAQPVVSFVGPTIPATFVSGDSIQIQVTYEAA